jgi:hypothetical protein
VVEVLVEMQDEIDEGTEGVHDADRLPPLAPARHFSAAGADGARDPGVLYGARDSP